MKVPGLEIIFNNGKEDLSLFYKIYEWPAAQKFYSLIEQSISNNDGMYNDTSFNITQQDEQQLLDDINKCIIGMNKQYGLNIELVHNEADLNNLHRDSVPVNCDYWVVINDRIHAYEQYKIQQDSIDPRVNAYFRFETENNIKLEDDDFLFFKADRDYGDLCLNYTYKGKHWLELQTDNDIEAVTDGQLQPETRIKPTGYMVFRPPSPTPFFRLNRFTNWFRENFPNEKITPDMAIGYLLVGKLIMPISWNNFYDVERTAWTKMLCEYKNLVDVKLINIDLGKLQPLLERSKMI